MITRPLDLASKLRPEPRSNDWVFFVNAGLIVLFFSMFGSRFVLAPSVGIELPEVAGANADAVASTHSITVYASGQILAGGTVDLAGYEKWAAAKIADWKRTKPSAPPSLLIVADRRVEAGLIAKISMTAYQAGFSLVRLAATEPKAASGGH